MKWKEKGRTDWPLKKKTEHFFWMYFQASIRYSPEFIPLSYKSESVYMKFILK